MKHSLSFFYERRLIYRTPEKSGEPESKSKIPDPSKFITEFKGRITNLPKFPQERLQRFIKSKFDAWDGESEPPKLAINELEDMFGKEIIALSPVDQKLLTEGFNGVMKEVGGIAKEFSVQIDNDKRLQSLFKRGVAPGMAAVGRLMGGKFELEGNLPPLSKQEELELQTRFVGIVKEIDSRMKTVMNNFENDPRFTALGLKIEQIYSGSPLKKISETTVITSPAANPRQSQPAVEKQQAVAQQSTTPDRYRVPQPSSASVGRAVEEYKADKDAPMAQAVYYAHLRMFGVDVEKSLQAGALNDNPDPSKLVMVEGSPGQLVFYRILGAVEYIILKINQKKDGEQPDQVSGPTQTPEPTGEEPTDEDPEPTDEDPEPTDEDPEPTDEDPEPTDEEPTDEEPTDEEPTDEEPTDEEPTDEEPTDEEPTDEEPTDEEPTDEEPTDEEPTDEEPTDEEPTDEEPTDEEPTDEEPTDEEPTDEEPTDEQPTDEEPTDEEPTDEEPTDEAPAWPIESPNTAPNIDLPKIKLTEKAKAWAEEQLGIVKNTVSEEEYERVEQQGGLVDMSSWLAPESKEKYQSMTNNLPISLGDGREAKVVSVDGENGYDYAIDITEPGGNIDRWYVSEPRWFYDQYPEGRKFAEKGFISLWRREPGGTKVDKQTQFSLPLNPRSLGFLLGDVDTNEDGEVDFKPILDNLDGVPTINPEGLVLATAEAIARRENEKNDPSEAGKFDLPKDEPIGYIGLLDFNPDDPVMKGAVKDAENFPELLAGCGYDIRSCESGHLEKFKELKEYDCYGILKQRVGELTKKGINTVYINIAGHGYSGGIALSVKERHPLTGKPTAYNELTPEQMEQLYRDYPDTNFVLNTMACFGGGMERSLWNFKDPSGERGRIRLFMQSSITSVNMEGRVVDRDNPYAHAEDNNLAARSSYYELFLAYYLTEQGMEYGKAHLAADEATKEYLGSNAQTWISTPDGSLASADSVTRGSVTKGMNKK